MKTKAVLSLLSALLLTTLLPTTGAHAASYTVAGGDGSFRRITAAGGRLTGVDLSASVVVQNGIQVSLARIAQQAAATYQATTSNLGLANGAAQLDSNGTLTRNLVTYNGNGVSLATIAALAEGAMAQATLGVAGGPAQLDANGSLGGALAAAAWTTAAQRSLGAHFGDDINVKDFGAIGDGTTDSTAAFLAAIRIATNIDLGATVVVPQGHYIVRQTLVATVAGDGGVHIRGAGMGETMIEFQIPAANANQDGIDIVGQPNTCFCYNENLPWRGTGLGNATSQGQMSSIENLTLKTTGGPGYPAGSMISATSGYSVASENQAPWLTISNVWGSGAGPQSAPVWLNGIVLSGADGVQVSNVYMDEHSSKTAGQTGVFTGPDGSVYAAGAAILLQASQIYANQTQGVQASNIQAVGFEAGIALGGVTQGNGVAGLGCANSNGNYNCIAVGGGIILDQDAGANVAVSGYAYGGDYGFWVSSTAGLSHGMKIVPSAANAAGVTPYGAIVDQVGTTATNGFYFVSWTTAAEATTQAFSGDTCTFKNSGGTTVTATCAAAAKSSLLTVSNPSATLAAGMTVADSTHAAAIPTGLTIAALGSGTVEMRLPAGTANAENNYSVAAAATPAAPIATFAPAGAVVLNDPAGAGGFVATGLDCSHVCLNAPASPFSQEAGYADLSLGASSIQSNDTPQIVLGGTTRANISGITWNNGGGVFAKVTNGTDINIYQNVIGAAGDTATVPAIQLTNTTGSQIYDNFVYGSQPLATDNVTTNLWGLNFWNGQPHLGLAGSPLALDAPLSGCLGTNGGAAWNCAVVGTVAAASAALLTPMGALPAPASTAAAAAAAAAATTLTVASTAPFATGMIVTDATTGASATVKSASGTTLTLYAPGLTAAVASGDQLANAYPPMGEVGGGIVPQDGSLWAQGACNDSTLKNRSMVQLAQQYDGTGTALGANGNSSEAIYASTNAGALFNGLALSTFPSGLNVPGILVTNSNAAGGASISCGFSVNLVKAP